MPTLYGTEGNDTVTGTDVAETILARRGNDLIDGGGGNDHIEADDSRDPLLNDNDTVSGGDGNDAIYSTFGNDVLNGNAGDDSFFVDPYNTATCVIDGGSGSDTLFAAHDLSACTIIGVEILKISSAAKLSVVQIDGFETLVLAKNSRLTLADAGLLDLSIVTTDFKVTASDLGNTIISNEGSQGLNGGKSADQLFGGANDDYLIGGAGDDRLEGGDGDDLLYGDAGDDILLGGSGNDHFESGIGNDVVDGGGGWDVLWATGNISGSTLISVEELAGIGSPVYLTPAQYNGFQKISARDLTLTAAGAISLAGNTSADGSKARASGLGNSIAGGDYADNITGGRGVDTLNGGKGNDSLVADEDGIGDIVNGENGDDKLTVDMFDTIDGGDGQDSVTMSTYGLADVVGLGVVMDLASATHDGVTVLLGGGTMRNVESFIFRAGQYDDVITDGPWDGNVHGGNGNDRIFGSAGNDYLYGDNGNDVLSGGVGNNYLEGGAGNDTFYTGSGNDRIYGGDGTDYLVADFSDQLVGIIGTSSPYGLYSLHATGSGFEAQSIDAIYIIGGSGDDSLQGTGGDDTLNGGLGNDTYVIDNAGDVVVEDVGQGIDTLQTVFTTILTAAIENLTLTGTTAINGTGNAGDNSLVGNNGNNLLSGLGGDDRLDGAIGLDTLVGGLGNDSYYVDNIGDVVTELNSQGMDVLFSSVSLALTNNQSIETLTLTGPQHINASGNVNANMLNGNTGNNTLNGGSGADTMSGGLGHDIYVVDNVGDVVVEKPNAGTDTVQSAVSFVLGDNVENLTLAGSAAINGTGNALNNTIYGNAGANVLAGGGGADKVYGRGGNDTYIVDNAAMGISELLGGVDAGGVDEVRALISYSLKDYFETLVLAGTGNINGVGNGLSNVLIGNSGNNLLTGGGGNDTITGGLGADQFIFGAGSGVDVVNDFTAAHNDRINVHGLAHGVINGAGIALSQVGGDTVIDLGGGNMVTLIGALKADVQSHVVW